MFDALFSTQGVMVMLLAAYGVAMWMFLTSAPKVHTIMVSDMEQARTFYEGQLELSIADVPLHYYYGNEYSLGAASDPMYYNLPMEAQRTATKDVNDGGYWYQLGKNAQLHIVPGAHRRQSNRDRHVCFNRDCVEQVLLRVQMRGVRHKVRCEKPLIFMVKDPDAQIIEIEEVIS
ncbi:hypothetical protein Pse7367_0023 [Thalassoporum mexicanum PCC 7367]|uniref:hypothetical protein n=1 Tax=Thalassoporum mexicanum TaxID=3457544 RepID=UPI00029FFC69|nr:hypothetical protein [Pseudanabaena sp. PCC 7367]AFY68344.1 hypothetical protein Pse7367_0023 [Pseudanabaena sp. PCC 7367]